MVEGVSSIVAMNGVRRFRWMVVFLIVIPMTVVAQSFHRSELIFPEAAALAIGTWGGEAHAWSKSKVELAFLPPIAASVAVLLNVFNVPTVISFVAMIFLVPVALDLLDSALIPTISAGALPILFEIKSPWFLLVVFTISTSLALGLLLGATFARRRSVKAFEEISDIESGQASRTTFDASLEVASSSGLDGDLDRNQDDIDEDLPNSPTKRRRVLAWFVVLSVVWTLATWWVTPHAALAPPIFVSFYEWLKSSGRTTLRYAKRWISITSGIAIGTIVHQSVANFVVSSVVAVSLTFFLMTILKEVHPPTLAISLLPLIFPATSPYQKAFYVSVSVAALYGLGLYLPRLIRHRMWTI